MTEEQLSKTTLRLAGFVIFVVAFIVATVIFGKYAKHKIESKASEPEIRAVSEPKKQEEILPEPFVEFSEPEEITEFPEVIIEDFSGFDYDWVPPESQWH